MREPAHLLRLRHLAASLLLLTPPFLEVQAHPNPQPQVPGSGGRPGGNPAPAPVIPWVSVDPAGSGITITPSVFTSDGARTTVNNPPDSLTSTATYTLSPGGTSRPDLASTYTGLAPVASATGVNNDAGAFIACDWRQGDDEPFCLPKRGAVLYPGRTYYVTWATSYFNPPDLPIAFQALYPNDTGFTTDFFPASVGFWAWTIPYDVFPSSDGKNIHVSLSLVFDDTETRNPNDLRQLDGPEVIIAPESQSPHHDNGGGDKRYAVAIAVPIIVVIVLLGLGGFCFWSWRRHGVLPVVGSRRSSGGQSRARGIGPGDAVGGGGGRGIGRGIGAGSHQSDKPGQTNFGIQLTDRDSWSPTTASGPGGGRNVFREELRRQEQQREG